MIDSKKNLPTDPFYKAVLIKESRRKATNDVDYDDIVDDCVELLSKIIFSFTVDNLKHFEQNLSIPKSESNVLELLLFGFRS